MTWRVAKNPRGRVIVINKRRKSIYLRHTCPVSGKQTWRSTRTSDPEIAKALRDEWQAQIDSVNHQRHSYPEVPKPIARVEDLHGYDSEFPGVYFLWRTGVVAYVGMSFRSICERLQGGNHKIARPTDRVSWLRFTGREIRLAECFYIGTLRPLENFRGADAKGEQNP